MQLADSKGSLRDYFSATADLRLSFLHWALAILVGHDGGVSQRNACKCSSYKQALVKNERIIMSIFKESLGERILCAARNLEILFVFDAKICKVQVLFFNVFLVVVLLQPWRNERNKFLVQSPDVGYTHLLRKVYAADTE
jgi:hypothetical protein